MKIAVIADAHCNFHALGAVLDDIAAEKPDLVVGAGDLLGTSAYPGARQVWRTLAEQSIPTVLGNEEARLLAFHAPLPDPYLRNSIQFQPLQYRAGQFSAADLAAIDAWPVNILLEAAPGRKALICHASPGDLQRSPMEGIDPQMARDLAQAGAEVIVVGHLHTTWHHYWQGKLLVMAGSAGLPLRGKVDEVDYLLLTFQKQAWTFRHKVVKYDCQAAIAEIIESRFLEQAGPIGWLMFAEALTQEDHLMPFLQHYCPAKKPDDSEGWKKLVIGYLDQVHHWDAVKPYILLRK